MIHTLREGYFQQAHRLQGKLDDARKAAQRGAELSLTRSDPALKLPAEIQQAHVEMAAAGDNAANLVAPQRRLNAVIATAKRLGYYNLECEARLALGQLELKANASLGHKRLNALASEARNHGIALVATQAQNAGSNSILLSQNQSAH